MQYELGIVGAGNMAEAIARGVMRAGVLGAGQIVAADVSPQRRSVFQGMGINAVEDAADAAKDAATVLLSVKPQQMAGVLANIGKALAEETLVISIAAGISSSFIESYLGAGKKWRVVRTMPNTPMLAGKGMAAIARGRCATEADMTTARRIFESAATVIELTEDKMDAVTAVSGSGPAYFFYLVEQMIRAGVEMGLTSEQAHTLATRTAAGAAKMLITSSDSPQELRRKVTSPGGTTQAAIQVMEERNVGQSIVDAVRRAAERSKELGS